MDPELVARTIDSQTLRDSTYAEIRADLLDCAIRYAHQRAKWGLADRETRALSDAERTRAHNVFIDACNILSRAMVRNGHDVTWRRALGDDRGRIGDVACYLHCIIALRAA